MHSLWWFKLGSNRLSSCKSLKQLIQQALFCLFKIDHHDSIRWLYLELPNKKPECPDMESWCSPLKYHCIPTTTRFSLPLSPLIVLKTHFRFDILSNNVRIVNRRTYIKAQHFPAETFSCSVNGETWRLQFIITVYMSHEVCSLRYIHWSYKFARLSSFQHLLGL